MSFQIETERLIIRDVREEDIPTLIGYFAEPESRRNILSFQAYESIIRKDLENAVAWAAHPQREYYTLSVALKSDGALIGDCSISKVVPGSFETSIGWHYGYQFRNNGYATEAARELLRIGFELHEVSEIYADCFAENKASIRIMEKLGMSPGWNFAPLNFIRGLTYGENKPTIRHTISRHEWLAKTKQRE